MNEHSPRTIDGDNIAPFIEALADECIDAMTKVADAANQQVGIRLAGQDVVMGQVNNWTDGAARRKLAQAQEEQREAARQLSREPLIARVRTRSENGSEKTYYFTRNFTILVPGITLTSYNSGAPVGRLASLDVGDEFELPNGQWTEVIEKGTYRPVLSGAQWDGVDNQIDTENFDVLFIESLRRAVEQRGRLGGYDLSDPFAVFDDQPVVTLTPKRKYLSGLGLRDQSVMNKVQDEIFRLPIDRQVMLEGPPGTGKTTTLIKRLSQKRIENSDREEDYRVIVNTLSGAITGRVGSCSRPQSFWSTTCAKLSHAITCRPANSVSRRGPIFGTILLRGFWGCSEPEREHKDFCATTEPAIFRITH
ncbi:hypothetical protein ACFSZS_24950 [Seohaeicola zhoushanensis]